MQLLIRMIVEELSIKLLRNYHYEINHTHLRERQNKFPVNPILQQIKLKNKFHINTSSLSPNQKKEKKESCVIQKY